MSRPYRDPNVLLKLVLDEPQRADPPAWFRSAACASSTPDSSKSKPRMRPETLPQGDLRTGTERLPGGARTLLDDGRLVRPQLSLDRVVTEALALVPSVVSATGCRTLDMLHIASARLLECDELITCDHRQAQAGTTAGLQVTLLRS